MGGEDGLVDEDGCNCQASRHMVKLLACSLGAFLVVTEGLLPPGALTLVSTHTLHMRAKSRPGKGTPTTYCGYSIRGGEDPTPGRNLGAGTAVPVRLWYNGGRAQISGRFLDYIICICQYVTIHKRCVV